MKPVFVDTSYLVAIINPRDAAIATALRLDSGGPYRLIVTEYVLVELANLMSRGQDRQLFLTLWDGLRGQPQVTIVPASAELFAAGLQLYRQRPDKDWSLTDSISFVVMQQHGLTEALTGDRHFEQAGFRALLTE